MNQDIKVIKILGQEVDVQKIKNPVLLMVFLNAQKQEDHTVDELWQDGHSDSWGDRYSDSPW